MLYCHMLPRSTACRLAVLANKWAISLSTFSNPATNAVQTLCYTNAYQSMLGSGRLGANAWL